MSNNKKFKV